MKGFFMKIILIICLALFSANFAFAQFKESEDKNQIKAKKENFKSYQEYNGKQSPFAQFHKNWSELSKLEKAKIMREFLGSEPVAWIDPKGNIPSPHYLSLAMNPMNRDIAEDFLLFQTEKSYRTSLAQLLPNIINYQQLIKLYSTYPQSLKDQIREHELFMRRPASDEAIKRLIDQRIKGFKKQLYIYQQEYKSVKRAYLSFEILPEGLITLGEAKRNKDYVPNWKKKESSTNPKR